MTRPDVAVRLPADIVDRAEALTTSPDCPEALRAQGRGLGRTHVIRLALAIGMRELERRAEKAKRKRR